MTTQPSPIEDNTQVFTPASKTLRVGFFKNLNIGRKLILGFGVLVVLMFLSIGVSYRGSYQATTKIDQTDEVRVPTALAASRAQANLLRMRANVRGYLALGNPEYQNRYHQSAQAFEANLAELDKLSPDLNVKDQQRLQKLRSAYQDWSKLPDQLFELRDDQLDREPAYRLLVITGTQYAGTVLININTMIETQGQREATTENLERLQDMAKFQGNFAAMLSALRGYVTTRNRIFRGEYEVNLTDNQNAWDRLSSKHHTLTSTQQELFDKIEQNRNQFLPLPAQIFKDLESNRWREDLYIFSTEAVLLANEMQELLNGLVADQQTLLEKELAAGRGDLAWANQLTRFSGIIAFVVSLTLSLIFHSTIAGSVVRLTRVAERIRGGDLEAQATVESKDEIGILAGTFNSMTAKLRDTLNQVRLEKRRADNLLEVVIPIGVELTTEKDFNHLLEKMLLEAKSFSHADAGVLYLHEKQTLKPEIIRNDTLAIALGGTTGKKVKVAPLPLAGGKTLAETQKVVAVQAAAGGTSINIPDLSQTPDFLAPDVFNGQTDYRAKSFLSIPLKNNQGQVLGVLELINARNAQTGQVIAFDQNMQQMMESFSSLAVAALEAYIREQSLKQEIQQLRIEIDEVKRQQEVQEIVETDFFQDLQVKARTIRRRGRRSKRDK